MNNSASTYSERKHTILAWGILLLILALVAFGQLSYNDFWWHLAVGKWMFITKSFLTHEIFSFAFQGKEWMNGTWIFDGLLYLIYSKSSFWGLGLFRFIIFAGAYIVAIKTVRIKYKTPLLFCVAVFILTVPYIRNFLRPEITQPLFVAFFLYALFSYKYTRSKIIYLLPIAEALWVNTHGSFEMGMILVGIFFGSELLRSLIRYRQNILLAFKKNKTVLIYFVILLLVAAATLINPLGYRIYYYVSAMLNDKETLASVNEWQPFSYTNLLNFSSSYLLPLALLACASVLMLVIRTVKLWKKHYSFIRISTDFFYEDMLLLVFFLYSMLQYVRLISIFAFMAAFIIAKNYRILSNKYEQTARITNPMLLLLALLMVYPAIKGNMHINVGPKEFSQAEESISFIKQNKLSGNLLNEYADGGELIWQLYPDYQVFIDGRAANVYDSNYYWYYRHLDNENILKAMTRDYNLAYAILPNGSGPSEILSKSNNWSLIFFDNFASVYANLDGSNKKISQFDKYTMVKPGKDEASYTTNCEDKKSKDTMIAELKRNITELKKPIYSMRILATVLAECSGKSMDDLKMAESIIKQTLSYQSNDPALYYKLGKVQIDLDKNQDATDAFQRSIKLTKNSTNMAGLGIALHNLGKYQAAEKLFSQVPFLPGSLPNEYYQIYGRVEYQLDHNAKAIELFHRYLDIINPDKITAQDYVDLSNAYKDNNEIDKAVQYSDLAKNFKTPTSTAILIPS